MTLDLAYVVRYETRIQEPKGSPAGSNGDPGSAGLLSDAAPSTAVEDILSSTPTSDDDRLVRDEDGVEREYRVVDRIDDETGERIVSGRFPADSQANAEAIADDVRDDLGSADQFFLDVFATPLGGVTVDEIREWYENHPDGQPVNDDGERYIPESWDPSNHTLEETRG